MAASWSGALSFGGFPVAVALYKTESSESGQGFKMLDPKHKQPIKQLLVDVEGKPVARDATLKGIPIGDEYTALSPEQVDRVEAEARSTIVEPSSFAPLASLPLDQASDRYMVLPKDKVPGADSSVNALWNGLRAMKVAYITTVCFKKRDATLAVYAADEGLRAVTLPYLSDLAKLPSFTPEVNKAQAAMVKGAIERYEVKPYDPSEYASSYAQRHQQVIDEVLAGVEPAEHASPITPGDLIAALAASQGEIATAVSKPKRKAKVKA